MTWGAQYRVKTWCPLFKRTEAAKAPTAELHQAGLCAKLPRPRIWQLRSGANWKDPPVNYQL